MKRVKAVPVSQAVELLRWQLATAQGTNRQLSEDIQALHKRLKQAERQRTGALVALDAEF